MGRPDEVPGSQLHAGSTMVITGIWGVDQQMQVLSDWLCFTAWLSFKKKIKQIISFKNIQKTWMNISQNMTWMTNWYFEKHSALLIIGEIQIKKTLRYHITLAGMFIIQKAKVNRCWQGCGEKWSHKHSMWECKSI